LWDPETQILVFSHHGGSTALRISAAGSRVAVETPVAHQQDTICV
jgi:hypothetical protein